MCTVEANKKFTFRFVSMIVLRCEYNRFSTIRVYAHSSLYVCAIVFKFVRSLIGRRYRIANGVDRVQEPSFQGAAGPGRRNEISYWQGKVVDVVSTPSFRAMPLEGCFFQWRVRTWSRRRQLIVELTTWRSRMMQAATSTERLEQASVPASLVSRRPNALLLQATSQSTLLTYRQNDCHLQ